MSANDDLLPNCVKHAKIMKEVEDQLKERKMTQRLIDGGELFIQACRTHDEFIGLDELAELLDKMPTIETIPVEWLKKHGAHLVTMPKCIFDSINMAFLFTLIKDWEDENGTENN